MITVEANNNLEAAGVVSKISVKPNQHNRETLSLYTITI